MRCMGFEVETLKFEGPLDLMLHLIHEQQLDIFDLDMEILTDRVENNIDENGTGNVEVDYHVSLEGELEGRNELRIEVTESTPAN